MMYVTWGIVILQLALLIWAEFRLAKRKKQLVDLEDKLLTSMTAFEAAMNQFKAAAVLAAEGRPHEAEGIMDDALKAIKAATPRH